MNTQPETIPFSATSLSAWVSYWNAVRKAHMQGLQYGPTGTESPILPVIRSWAVMYKSGDRFGNYRLMANTPISFEKSPDSVVVTLICAGVSESGENQDEALENLAWYINHLLDEQTANSNQLLGKRLAKRMEILKKTFKRVPTNH